MNVTFTPFEPGHLQTLTVRPEQRGERLMYLSPGMPETLRNLSLHAETAWLGTRIVGCAGVLHVWPGRAQAWAVISVHVKGVGLACTKRSQYILRHIPVKRVEAVVLVDFKEAHRWARALGFSMECERMVGYCPDGSDAALYSRIR